MCRYPGKTREGSNRSNLSSLANLETQCKQKVKTKVELLTACQSVESTHTYTASQQRLGDFMVQCISGISSNHKSTINQPSRHFRATPDNEHRFYKINPGKSLKKQPATTNAGEARRGFPTLLYYLKYPVFNNKKECKENRKIQPIIEKAGGRKCG